MNGKQDAGRNRSPQAVRGERLAAALRANLKRRKMQARGRAGAANPADAPEAARRKSGSGQDSAGD